MTPRELDEAEAAVLRARTTVQGARRNVAILREALRTAEQTLMYEEQLQQRARSRMAALLRAHETGIPT